MHNMCNRLLVFLLVSVVLSEIAAYPEPVLHEAPDLPCSWQKVSHSLTEEHRITIRFALKQRNLEKLKSLAVGVSDPQSSTYGQFLSTAEISSLTAPDPSHIEAVEAWLAKADVPFRSVAGGQTIEALLSVATATKLLNTKFHYLFNEKTKQHLLRAGNYWLPAYVHEVVAAVYGLHGLPAPHRERRKSTAQAPDVTPEVLAATYQISGVKVSSSATNRQAVAEFQGETTNATDLRKFFKHYVASAAAEDAKVYKFVGNNGTGHEGDEAGLDIQYIMGTAPGIKTEFWYWRSDDFCADLKNWTDTLLSDEAAPLVHSVSYGYQGPLRALGCAESNVEDVDINFAKLAAKGITIIFSSGDSGAGYQPSCAGNTMARNTSVIGEGASTISAVSAAQCCQFAATDFQAWTFTPPSTVAAPQCSPQNGQEFEGKLIVSGQVDSNQVCCEVANDGSYPDAKGYTFDGDSHNCSIFGTILGTKSKKSATSSHVTPPNRGICMMYQRFLNKSMTPGAVSGGASIKPISPQLYPSWPASSPWVTSVGATRFIKQKVGQPEMASDDFGSGGGFSSTFNAFEAQVNAVSHYLQTATNLPPAGTFPPGGRATPDVSALGEGYLVLVDGGLESVGGTSASAPVFAAMVSLLNEARLQAGANPMGYLNPFLYQNAHAFRDVTVGTNALGRSPHLETQWGFSCAKGWDPVTGLGTPIFSKLLESALAAGTGTVVI